MTTATRPPKRTDPPRPKRPRQYTDAAPIRLHLHHLSQHGIGLRAVADLTGTSRSTIERIAGIAGIGSGSRQPTKAVTRPIATAILAIQPGIDTARDGALIDPTGSTRRLQALIALGYPGRYLAARLGADPKWLPIYRTPEHVRAASARAIRDLYDALSMRSPNEFPGIDRGGSTRARNHAQALGWPRPLEWDDDEIDNPNAQPRLARRPDTAPKRTVSDAELEDLDWILRTSDVDPHTLVGREQIAARLGVTEHRVEYMLAAIKQRGLGVAA